MTDKERYKARNEAYRNARIARGWRNVYRLVPGDLAVEINRIIAKHRADHFDVWQVIKKG